MSDRTEPAVRPGPHGELALTIAIAALLLLAIFQTVGVIRNRLTIDSQRAAQQPAMEQSLKLRTQLQTIAGRTAELADAGDTTARDVLDLMHREGVTITPRKQPQEKQP